MTLNNRAYVPLQWANSMEEMMSLTDHRVNDMQDKVHLVGFSMGGYIASSYALENTEKVASLTLVGCSSRGLTDEEIAQRKRIVSAIKSKRYSGMGKQRMAEFFHPESMKNEDLVDLIQSMNEDLGPIVLQRHIESTTPRPDLTKALSKLNIPIHLIAGETDKIAPPQDIANIHQQLKNSSFEVIPDTGHMMLIEAPRLAAQTIEKHLK